MVAASLLSNVPHSLEVKGFYCIVRVTKYNESPATISVDVESRTSLTESIAQITRAWTGLAVSSFYL